MEDRYSRLVKLQKETIGATFIMGYSMRTSKHYVYIVQKKKRFESMRCIEDCMDEAIKYISESRTESNENEIRWTLHALRF